uniref:R13L1/DRL21-like LRR repeat region domain-containing protein n=1 Tax=Nelumbo nucifera TaxID=4432 RepID=A0A822YHZ8_NELNU|nr:TPA_asm: hypothetical protein HUJ06_011051 [Nelumbo nucifera]
MNKYQITKLTLEWSSNFDGNFPGNGASAESVLEGLQPSTKLRCLGLHHYGGSSFPNWMMKEFQHYDMLVHIQLYGCKNCTFLPAFGNLPSLKYLYMHGMKEVEYMGKEFYGCRDNNNNYKGFQMLELLCIQKMKSLRGWWGAEEGEFPCLKELSIGCCPNLVKLPHLLPSVEEVDIRACSVLTYLPMLPSTSRLSLENCDGRILSCMHNCPSLSKLEIRNFPNTTFLPPAILQPLAKTLETLKIWCFQSLLALPKGLQDLAILQNLEIYNCNMLQSLPDLQALASLRRLEIRGCESLAYLPKGLNKLTSFQELIIEWTNKMTPVLEEGVGLQDLASLPKLKIYKSSLSSFLPKGLNKLTSLQELTIYWSKNTKSISEEKLPSSLHSLTIWKCPEEIKSRLQEGGEDWPKIAHIPTIQLYSMQHSSSR